MSIRTLLLSLSISCAVVSANAQLTITQTDVQTMFHIGAQFTSDAGNTVPSLGIGTASSTSQTFDFSAITFTPQSFSVTVVDPASTPYASVFPAATLAGQVSGAMSVYDYYAFSAEGLLHYGRVFGPDTQRYNPPQVDVKLPMTLGTTWNYQGDTLAKGPMLKEVTQSTKTVDAFGSITIAGTTLPCLRIKEITNTATISAPPPPAPRTVHNVRTLTFTYQMNNGSSCAVGVDSADENNATAAPRSISYNHPGDGTAVRDNAGAIPGLSLVANYPNPFRDISTLTYQLAGRSEVRIEVTNMLGQTIGTLINTVQPEGRYNLSLNGAQLTAGKYVVRLTVNGNTAVHSLSVVK